MKKIFWKRLLLVNSVLWAIAAVYFVYGTTYGILTLNWGEFLHGLEALAAFTVSQAVIALIGD